MGVIVQVPVEDNVSGPSVLKFQVDLPVTEGDIVNTAPYAVGHVPFCVAILASSAEYMRPLVATVCVCTGPIIPKFALVLILLTTNYFI
jgi:hypothetical protein